MVSLLSMSQLQVLQIFALIGSFDITLDGRSDLFLDLGELVLVEILKKFLLLVLGLLVPKVVWLLILGLISLVLI